MLWNIIYFCDAQLYFQHHYSSLQCHMIFRNHSNILIYCSRNISDYYQCWKQLCCTIFCGNWYILFFRIHRWIESSEEQHLFEIEIFCNINVFTVSIDQFNACLLGMVRSASVHQHKVNDVMHRFKTVCIRYKLTFVLRCIVSNIL